MMDQHMADVDVDADVEIDVDSDRHDSAQPSVVRPSPEPVEPSPSPHVHVPAHAHKIGPLWIRRQLFEHSVAVPLLTSTNASQIDFSRLAAELHAASVTKPPAPPAVTYDDWVAAAGLYARLDSSEHAAIIVESLETNAPDAFLRCNDAAKLNSPDQLPFRQLLIPVPELLAFLKLHAAATVSSSYRNVADSVWPMSEDMAFAVSNNSYNNNSHKSPNVLAPISLTPASPRIIHHSPGTPTRQSPVAFIPQQQQQLQQPHSNPPNNSPVSSSPPSLTKSILEAAGNEQLFSSLQLQQQQQSSSSVTSPQPDAQSQQKQAQQPSTPKQLTPQRQQAHAPNPALSPSNQRQQQAPSNQSSPHQQLLSSPVHGPPSNNFEGLVRKKSHMSPVMNSQSAIIASGHHALERETRLVVTNLRALLLVIVGAYGFCVEENASDDKSGGQSKTSASRNNSGTNGSGTIIGAAETGSLSPNDKSQQQVSTPAANSTDATSTSNSANEQANPISDESSVEPRLSGDAVMADSNHMPASINTETPASQKGKSANVNQIRITRQMFEHLSFLFTTSSESSGAYRSMCKIVPLWNKNQTNMSTDTDVTAGNSDSLSGTANETISVDEGEARSDEDAIALQELLSIVTTALTQAPTEEVIDQNGGGVIDVVDICDLERKTVIRTSMPPTNQAPSHPSEVRIVNCQDVHIYLLCALGRVSFVNCRGCTLFVGGCVSLSLINCENVRVHAIARVVRITNCFDTHLYLCTNNRPQIVGENRGLVFAPYNAVYPRAELDKHLEVVGVDIRRNVWDQFYRPAMKGCPASGPGLGPGSGSAPNINSLNKNNANNKQPINKNNNTLGNHDDNSSNNSNSNNSNKQSTSTEERAISSSTAADKTGIGNGNDLSAVIARTMDPEQFLPFAVPVRYLEGTIISEGVDEVASTKTTKSDDDAAFDAAAAGGTETREDAEVGSEKDKLLSNESDKTPRKWDSSLKCLFGVCVPLPAVYSDNLKQKRSLVVKVREEIRQLERKWTGEDMAVDGSDVSSSKAKDVAMGDKEEDADDGSEDKGKKAAVQPQEEHKPDSENEAKTEKGGGELDRNRYRRRIAGGIVHSVIQEQFREWLTHSGRIRQISDLFRMVQE